MSRGEKRGEEVRKGAKCKVKEMRRCDKRGELTRPCDLNA